MVDELRISREMERRFGDEFTRLMKQHEFLLGVWRNSDDPELMFWLLRLSPYRQYYYEDFVEFVRGLYVDQTARRENLGSVDTVLARQRPVIEERHARRADRDELVALELFDLTLYMAERWICETAKAAIGEAIWAGQYPQSETEKLAYQNSVCASLRRKHADRLRELIYTPFLPKINVN